MGGMDDHLLRQRCLQVVLTLPAIKRNNALRQMILRCGFRSQRGDRISQCMWSSRMQEWRETHRICRRDAMPIQHTFLGTYLCGATGSCYSSWQSVWECLGILSPALLPPAREQSGWFCLNLRCFWRTGCLEMADPATRSLVDKIPLCTVNAGPRSPQWEERLKEEYMSLINYLSLAKENDKEWFKIEANEEGTEWEYVFGTPYN